MSLIVVALFVSAQAVAEPQSTVPAPVAAPAPAPKVKVQKVCRTEEATSGSRMPHRVCMTEEEWDNHAQGMSNSAHSGYSGSTDDDH